MSLRDLALMARAKLESEWARTGVIAAAASSAFGGKFEPMKFIPPAYRPGVVAAKPKTEAELESESKRAWRMLDRFFGKGK